MGRAMTKDQIVAAIRTERQHLEETLSLFSEEQMQEPLFTGGWSVKDILAHIVFWEQRTLRGIRASLRGEAPPPIKGIVDTINKRVYEENHDRPLPDVTSDFHHSFREFIEQVAALAEDDMADPLRFAWTRGKPLRNWIRVDSQYHYVQHNRQLRAWLER